MNEDELKINEDTIEELEIWYDEDARKISVQITLVNEYIWFDIDVESIEQGDSQRISYDGERR